MVGREDQTRWINDDPGSIFVRNETWLGRAGRRSRKSFFERVLPFLTTHTSDRDHRILSCCNGAGESLLERRGSIQFSRLLRTCHEGHQYAGKVDGEKKESPPSGVGWAGYRESR